MREKLEIRLIGPMATVIFLALIGLIGALWLRAVQADTHNRIKEQNLVKVGVSRMADTSAQLMTPMTIWNKAVESTAIKYDPEWVQKNYGTYFKQYVNYERSYVLNGDDHVVYAALDGKQVAPDSYMSFSAQAAPLVRELRSRLPDIYANYEKPGNHSNFAARLIGVGGNVFIIGASMVLPDQPESKELFVKNPYMVVSLHQVTKSELQLLASQYLLAPPHELRLSKGEKLKADEISFDLHDPASEIVTASIAWVPDRPGLNMFIQTAVPVILITGFLGAFSLIMLYRSQTTANHLQASEAKAKHMAMHDALTGLPNRSLFADRLIQARERLKRQGGFISVMCIGMDRFKDVNDTLGHAAGDELIRYNANALSNIIRAGDTLARLGGDEFVIIQTDTDPHSAASLAKRVLDTLTGIVSLESGQVFSSCSIGVTLLQDGEIEPSEALRQADLALYRAKEDGRGQYCFFEPEMDATIKLRKQLESGLRAAIREDNIEVFYQPQVDHLDNLVGVEALARWAHPERGPISPGYFIPLAEECGLMTELGAMIMRKAVKDAKRWPNLKVAINVSASQMKSADFMATIREIMATADINPAQIEIEITEGVLLNDDNVTQHILRDIRHMGFSIALDDFGTGYSSLSYLNRYPVDKIKIDRSFVSNLGADPEAEAVVRAIIKLAKALNLNVLAEGVETAKQRQVLKLAGCNIIQGFIFSKPITAFEIDSIVGKEIRSNRRTFASHAHAQALMK